MQRCLNYLYPDIYFKSMFFGSIALYFNYKRINEKMKRKKDFLEKEEYFLIKKDLMKEIKRDYNYNKISILLKKYNIQENDNKTKMLSVLKDLSDDELNKYFKESENNELKRKYKLMNYQPDVKTLFNKSNICNMILIYDNFEIIEKDIIKLFIDNINKLNDYYLECIINEGKIIIHYPDNFGKKQYTSVIGSLDKDNSFITEYILVYQNQNEKNIHLHHIAGQLKNYLNKLQLYKGTEPIINRKYEEIGTIIKYNEIIINDNAIDNNMNQYSIIRDNNINNYNNNLIDNNINNSNNNMVDNNFNNYKNKSKDNNMNIVIG